MEPSQEDIRHLRYLTDNWRRPSSAPQRESWERLVLLGFADLNPSPFFPRWTLTESGKALKLRHYDGLLFTAHRRT